MRKSLQLKMMLSIVAVTVVVAVVMHHTYYVWFSRSAEQAAMSRLERALFSYDGKTLSSDNQVQLIEIARRFELSGIGLFNPSDNSLLVDIGLPVDLLALSQWIERNLSPAVPESHIEWMGGQGDDDRIGIRRLERGTGRNLFLIASVSMQEAFASRSALYTVLWLTLTGCILITLLLSYLLRDMVANPVRHLAEAMQRVASGDLQSRVCLDVDAELVEVTQTFNRMVEELEQHRITVQTYQDGLEKRIEEIRSELQAKDAELIQAAKLASVGELAAGVAHELNNPLHHILLTADLVKEDVADDATRERIDRLMEQARRCRHIVSDLLEYSRREGMLAESFSVAPIVDEVISQFRQQGYVNGATIDVSQAEPVPQVCGSREEILRVISNILLNALQAIPEKDGNVSVLICSLQVNEVAFVISDNGPGMSEEIRKRAFEPFYTTKNVGQGTGLGLSIAYGIVTRHRGRLLLESGENGGTRVTVFLPAAMPSKTSDSKNGDE